VSLEPTCPFLILIIMACDLTGGRAKPCKDAVGGIRKIHFVDFADLGDITLTDDEVTDMDGTFDYHTYDVKGNSSLETNIQTSLENGTTFFESVVNLTLHKLTKEDNKELKLMAFGRPHVFVETFDGSLLLVGREHGAEVTGGTMVTGTAMGDLQGYTLTLTANEVTPPNFVSGATAADPFAGMSSATDSPSTKRTP
jgi:hypothetical protein